MKKVFIVFLFIFLSAFAKQIDDISDISADYLEDISIIQFIEDQCVLRAYDYDIYINKAIRCYNQSIKAYEKEIDKHLKNIKEKVSKENYNQLIKSQKEWREYSKEYATFLDHILSGRKQKPDCIEINMLHKIRMYKNLAENLSYFDYLIKQNEVN